KPQPGEGDQDGKQRQARDQVKDAERAQNPRAEALDPGGQDAEGHAESRRQAHGHQDDHQVLAGERGDLVPVVQQVAHALRSSFRAERASLWLPPAVTSNDAPSPGPAVRRAGCAWPSAEPGENPPSGAPLDSRAMSRTRSSYPMSPRGRRFPSTSTR